MFVVKYKFCGIDRVLEFTRIENALEVFENLVFSSKVSDWFSELELIC